MEEIQIKVNFSLHSEDIKMLEFVYRKILTSDNLDQYFLLFACQNITVNDQYLKIGDIDKQKAKHQRIALEQVKLLKTYQDKNECLIFELQRPLSYFQFCQDEILSRKFHQEVGSDYFKFIQQMFIQEKITLKELTTSSMKLFNQKLEANEHQFYLDNYHYDELASQFNLTRFLQEQDEMLLPKEILNNKENMLKIMQIRKDYQMDELELYRIICRQKNILQTKLIDEVWLSYYISHYFQNDLPKDIYQLSPLRFLKKLRKDKPVSKQEITLIHKIQNEYYLENDALNFLLELNYKKNKSINLNYVEKVASDWAAKGIFSKEKASQEVKRLKEKATSKSRKNKENAKQVVPNWYTSNVEDKHYKQEMIEITYEEDDYEQN